MKNEITAKRLRLALDNANMKPQELAEKSKVSKSSISQYVNGSHAPSNISAGKIGKVLDVEPLWLMGFDVPMERMAFKDAPKNFHSSFDNIENFKVAYDKSKLRSNKLLNSIMENAEQLNNDNRKSLFEYSQNFIIKSTHGRSSSNRCCTGTVQIPLFPKAQVHPMTISWMLKISKSFLSDR